VVSCRRAHANNGLYRLTKPERVQVSNTAIICESPSVFVFCMLHCKTVCRARAATPGPGSRQSTPGGNSPKGFHEWSQTISPLGESPLCPRWCDTLHKRLDRGFACWSCRCRPVGRRTGILKSLHLCWLEKIFFQVLFHTLV
jgi:hypothetical protein